MPIGYFTLDTMTAKAQRWPKIALWKMRMQQAWETGEQRAHVPPTFRECAEWCFAVYQDKPSQKSTLININTAQNESDTM